MDRMTANPGGETFYPVNPEHPVKGFGSGWETVWRMGTPCEGTRPTASFEGEHRTFNIQHSTSNIQHPTFNIQHSTSNIQHPTFNIQHPTSNRDGEKLGLDGVSSHHKTRLKAEMGNAQSPKPKAQDPTSNIEHRTSNTEHRTSKTGASVRTGRGRLI
jgi:hypothetical protein